MKRKPKGTTWCLPRNRSDTPLPCNYDIFVCDFFVTNHCDCRTNKSIPFSMYPASLKFKITMLSSAIYYAGRVPGLGPLGDFDNPY